MHRSKITFNQYLSDKFAKLFGKVIRTLCSAYNLAVNHLQNTFSRAIERKSQIGYVKREIYLRHGSFSYYEPNEFKEENKGGSK